MSLRDRLQKTAHRRAMHAAIARLEMVMTAKLGCGETRAAPTNNHTVWRTQMRVTTVKTVQNINRLRMGKK